jgi:hypothetical protein
MAQSLEEAPSADAPWMRQKDWACGRIHSAGVARLILWWIVAGLWNGFMLILIAVFWGDPENEDVVKVLSLFELVGVGILIWAVRRTWAWLRYGGSVLELSSTPGVIGGMLEGQIQTGIRTFPTKPVQLVLTCLRRRYVKRRKESNTTTDILWEADRGVEAGRFARGPRGLAIPVRIAIPYGLPCSDSSDPDNQIHWQLVISSDLPGVDFRAEFRVPVFVTADSKNDWTKEKVDEMADRERKAESLPESLRAQSWMTPVRTRPTRGGGMEYIFRMDTPLKMVMGLTLTAVLICAGSFGLYIWLGELGPFAILPGIIGLLLLLAAIGAWTFKSRVLIENGMVSIRKSLLGIPLVRKIRFSEISQVRVRQEELDGVQGKNRPWDIEIGCKEGRPIRIGASIREQSEAARLAAEIRQLAR